MKELQMKEIAGLIDKVLSGPANEKNIREAGKAVKRLVKRFPLYKSLIKKLERE